MLLERHGVVTKGAVVAERLAGGFAAVYPVLRAFEESGRCRRGYFVDGLGGAQFALPGAVDRMRAASAPPGNAAPTAGPEARTPAADPWSRTPTTTPWSGTSETYPGKTAPEAEADPRRGASPDDSWDTAPGTGSWDAAMGAAGPWSPRRPVADARRAVVLAAADPANPYGAALPWPAHPGDVSHKPGRKAGALVVLVDGHLALYVERGGKTLLSFADDDRLRPAVDALALAVRDGALGKLTVERADGTAINDSPLAAALEAAGFHPTPRGLRLRA